MKACLPVWVFLIFVLSVPVESSAGGSSRNPAIREETAKIKSLTREIRESKDPHKIIQESRTGFREGGITSGGGDVVYPHPNAAPILYDLFLLDPDFRDEQHGSPIQASRSSHVLGFGRIQDPSEVPAYKFLQNRLNIWRASSPTLIRMLEASIVGMEWTYTIFEQKMVRPIEDGRPLMLQNAIVYDVMFRGVRISLPVWNRLGLQSQAGLILHEALRHIQIALAEQKCRPGLEQVLGQSCQIIIQQLEQEHRARIEHIQKKLKPEQRFSAHLKEQGEYLERKNLYLIPDFSLSDEVLRSITAQVILTQPKDAETLDREEWFRGQLGYKVHRHLVRIEQIRWIQARVARQLENLPGSATRSSSYDLLLEFSKQADRTVIVSWLEEQPKIGEESYLSQIFSAMMVLSRHGDGWDDLADRVFDLSVGVIQENLDWSTIRMGFTVNKLVRVMGSLDELYIVNLLDNGDDQDIKDRDLRDFLRALREYYDTLIKAGYYLD